MFPEEKPKNAYLEIRHGFYVNEKLPRECHKRTCMESALTNAHTPITHTQTLKPMTHKPIWLRMSVDVDEAELNISEQLHHVQ
jgi:hypothetical protein